MAISEALSTQSVRTTWPRMSSPRISPPFASASAGSFCELDPAGLAATAGQHLSLDHDLAADLLGGGARLGRRGRDPAVRDRDAEAAEELLALILVEVQAAANLAASIAGMRRTVLLAVLLLTGCGDRRPNRQIPPARAAEPQHAELDWRESHPSTGERIHFAVDELTVR